MDEFDLFAMKSKKANKTNLSVHFLGESMAHQSAFEINWPLRMLLFIVSEPVVLHFTLYAMIKVSKSKGLLVCNKKQFSLVPKPNQRFNRLNCVPKIFSRKKLEADCQCCYKLIIFRKPFLVYILSRKLNNISSKQLALSCEISIQITW